MGLMDNFKQAVTELTGSEEQGGGNKASEQALPGNQQRRPDRTIEELDEDADLVDGISLIDDEEGVKVISNARGEAAGKFSRSLDMAVSKAPASGATGTVIAAGTVVDGNISSNDDLLIHGVVNGDVLNARKLIIYGEVAGSISAIDISLVDSIIAGNVVAQSSTEMTKDSCILGDLTTQNVVVSGKVKGNIEARGNGIFKKE